ncbi:hypothetical protein ACFOOK_16120 [Micromonospora krabiensis]|uniref:YCII-related domain-containing protein n=1 Tax=Micromonospora krabiensis TaxID=307121 RepID=A0A1C3N0B9_9ACTN|nr:hypothetical protein [Micromonospora krabiensis]SBV26030.1 hypothetical protein GA0070620_1512 [Micromonospora krabiensis]
MTGRLFALEQYDCSPDAAASAPAFGTPDCRLVAAVRISADDVVIALVEGADADAVAAAARAADWRVDRLVPARWIYPPEQSTDEAGPPVT